MRISRKMIGVLACLSMLTLAGCGADKKESPVSTVDSEGDKLLESAAANGSVVQFAENGCTLNPVIEQDDGKTAVGAAPGSEDETLNINVKYGTDCVFQYAKINSKTGKTNFSEASFADVKKQSHLLIYGDAEDEHNVTASKVLIVHFE